MPRQHKKKEGGDDEGEESSSRKQQQQQQQQQQQHSHSRNAIMNTFGDASAYLAETISNLDKHKFQLPHDIFYNLNKTYHKIRHPHEGPTKKKNSIPPALNKTLHKFVIKNADSSVTGHSWEFQNMFVLEFTTLNVFLLLTALCFWVINRQAHLRPTRGSKITRRKSKLSLWNNENNNGGGRNGGESGDDNDDDDDLSASYDDEEEEEIAFYEREEDDDYDAFDGNLATLATSATEQQQDNFDVSLRVDAHGIHNPLEAPQTPAKKKAPRPPRALRRYSTSQRRLDLMQQMTQMDTEDDDDGDEFFGTSFRTTSNNMHSSIATSTGFGGGIGGGCADISEGAVDDGDELFAFGMSIANINTTTSLFLDGGTIPLTKEKRALYKVLKQIKILSYLDEEAMALCLEHVDYYTYSKAGDTIISRGDYDGSLYAVMSGSVRCRFHKYKLPEEEESDQEEMPAYQRLFGSTYQKGEVVTSILAMMAGMVDVMTKPQQQQPQSPQNGNSNGNHSSSSSLLTIMPIAQDISAVALEDDTQVIRISPKCFAQVMERYPANVYRIAQNALNRAQRLTVLTLVQTLGLRKELVVRPSTSSTQRQQQKQRSPSKPNLVQFDDDQNHIKDTACAEFAKILGIPVQDDGAESLNVLKEFCEIVTLPKDHVLIQTGETHDGCYLLLNGHMELGLQMPKHSSSSNSNKNNNSWHFQTFQTIPPGYLIGEHCCFSGDLSLFHTVCGSSGCTLLRVPRHIYLHLIRRHPLAMAKSLKGILKQISSEVHLLNWTSEWLHVEAAEEVVRRGEPCDSMLVVLNGRLRSAVSSRKKKQDPRLTDLEFGRGKIVGEVGCITRSKWEMDVYAIRNSEIVRVQMRTLLVIIGEYPKAGMHFARSIATKVAEHYYSTTSGGGGGGHPSNIIGGGGGMMQSNVLANEWSPSPAPNVMRSYGLRLATIAVVPLTDVLSIDKFCSTLVNSFSEIAPCKLLTKQLIRGELGEKVYRNRSEMRKLRITRLLADMEENFRLVVYQADQKYTWWTRLCIQQADCILLVVNADRAPSLRRVEQSLEWAHKSINVRIELVVVGNPNQDDMEEEDEYEEGYFEQAEEEEMTVSDQLNNWSEQRKWISGHHLVRKPFRRYPMDFRRLSRRVTGRAVGLVLGAGGARGLAHVGVIKALKEAGVTVDLVGGTSQGAFVGALFAKQPDDYKQCEEDCRKMAADMSNMQNKLFDLTLPMTSMFCGRLFNRGIRKRLGKNRIQDLVLNFFCVSVDLQKQQQIVHKKGVLWKYCRASMSLTQYLPPVAENGTLLVDGGYMNALPVDVMRQEMNPRLVIAVDVSQEIEREYYDYGVSLSGWWVLWNSWNPFAKTVQVPSMGDISDMLIWVSSERHRRNMKMASDLYLTPPVTNVGTLEYDRFDELVQIGYEHAKPMVAEFVRKNPWVVTDAPINKKPINASPSPTKIM